QSWYDPYDGPQFDTEFGKTLAVDGDLVVIGAPRTDTHQTIFREGLVYVYSLSTGELVTSLRNPDPESLTHFGSSVAISGNTVVVGAPGGQNVGTAYVFNATTAELLQQWESPIGSRSFGGRLAISGSTVLVATRSGEAGEVYIYDAMSGELRQTLVDPAPGTTQNRWFGERLGISGNSAIVSSNDSAYVFNTVSGELLCSLPSTQGDTWFRSVAISGNIAVVATRNPALISVYEIPSGQLLKTIQAGSDAFSLVLSDGILFVSEPFGDEGGSVSVFDLQSGDLVRTWSDRTPSYRDMFGESVAVSGDLAVIGIPNDLIGGFRVGSAAVYSISTGDFLKEFTTPAPASHLLFGQSAALSDDLLAIGDHGHVYLYDLETGSLLRTLHNPLSQFDIGFGKAVAIADGLVIVGEDWDPLPGAGTAYVFDASTGELLRSLAAPVSLVTTFGWDVISASGTTLIAGEPDEDGNGPGAAYLFDLQTGELIRRLTSPVPMVGRIGFGAALATSDGFVVVGSPSYTDQDRGRVCIYDAATGDLLRQIESPSPDYQRYFGCQVAMNGGVLAVASLPSDSSPEASSVVHLFEVSTGRLLRTIPNPGSSYHAFGSCMAMDGTTLVVGNGMSAYLFDVATGDCLGTLLDPRQPDSGSPWPVTYFGNALGIVGDRVLVGAPYDHQDGYP
ncbi:MAG: PQQ-binding-like beta-propeller repeat protein, partial [Bryobacteraceae bacterium]|nr:PQQ-binding-like beta-propeller repeat protein [Bryobacteraceae bacterium]